MTIDQKKLEEAIRPLMKALADHFVRILWFSGKSAEEIKSIAANMAQKNRT